MDVHHGLAQRVTTLLNHLKEMEPIIDSPKRPNASLERLQQVSQRIAHVKEHNGRLEACVAELAPRGDMNTASPSLPQQLTWQARRLVLRGRDFLEQLKTLAGDLLGDNEEDHLSAVYHQTLAMTEMALRSVQSFPDETGGQLRLCEGLDATLAVIVDRVRGLRAVVDRRRADAERIESLGQLLIALVRERPLTWKSFRDLAETIAEEARLGLPLRLLHAGSDRPEQQAAAHCLNVAQVMARLARNEAGSLGRSTDPVLAALLFDAGMAALSPDVLGLSGPLDEEQRRQIEAHVGLSAHGVKRIAPAEGWLVDVIRAHHERLDGTGYPAGMRGQEIPRLARLLAVCDVYVAFLTPRPDRPALSPRAALTETLLEAEKGRLDAELAEYLLDLSFYPVGTVVELADGHLGVVVATNRLRGDLSTPSRPIVQLLAEDGGKLLPWPEYVNLAQCEGRHIVRSLSREEGRDLLGERHWQLL